MKFELWCFCFGLSGMAATFYEVTFNKYVTYVFGSTAHATATVLAAYMAGLSLGSYLAARVVPRIRRPLLVYGFLELGAGLSFLAAPRLLTWFAPTQSTFGSDPSLVILTLFQFFTSATVIVPPTAMLGATFPIALGGLSHLTDHQTLVGRLYGSNTLGTAVGALAASYLLIPHLGLSGTLRTGLSIGTALSMVGLVAGWRPIALPDRSPTHADEDSRPPLFRSTEVKILAFASGAIVLAYEVLWTHLFSLLLGNSVYSFALVLFSVLLGMAIGSALVDRAGPRLFDWLIRSQAALLVSLAFFLLYVDFLPTVFTSCGTWVTSFEGRELVKLLLTTATLLLPCTGLGFLFPALIALAGPGGKNQELAVGSVYGANTLGAVAGSILGGFVLLSTFGSKGSLLVLLGITALMAAFLLRRVRGTISPRPVITIASLLGIAAALHPSWNWQRLLQATGIYFEAMPTSDFRQILAFDEDVHGGVTTVVEGRDGVRTLLSNGKFQGDDGPEIKDQYSQALLTELFPHGHTEALNIGIGVGGTLGVLSQLSYRKVTAVELAGRILDQARHYFARINFHSLDDPRVELRCTDGRHYLSLLPPDRLFDTVAIQVSSIWFAGAANLYSQEFYRLVAEHLAPEGVMQQWVPLHHTRLEELLVIIKTARTTFPYLVLFVPGHQGILIASQHPLVLDAKHIAGLPMPPGIARTGLDFEDLAGSLLLDSKQIDDLLAREARSLPLSTDDGPYLEFQTPKGNALGFNFSDVVGQLVTRRAPRDHDPITGAGAPPEVVARLSSKFKLRQLEMYRPYTTAWLRILNQIDMSRLTPTERQALVARLSRKARR